MLPVSKSVSRQGPVGGYRIPVFPQEEADTRMLCILFLQKSLATRQWL